MKNKLHILVPALVLIVAVSVVATAEAGIFGKSKNKETPNTWRFQRSPGMNFTTGTLTRDPYLGWKIGEDRVIMARECMVVGRDGETCNVSDGDKVMIMGPRAGGTIVAWQIRTLAPNYLGGRKSSNDMVVWSDSDPTVGECSGPN